MLYFFENNTGTRAVLLISLLVPLFSVCCTRMAAKSVTVSMRVPETVRTGEKIRCEMTVSGNRWLAGCTAACTLTGVNRMTGEAFRTEVTAGGKGTAAAEAESSRCGCLFLSVTRAEVRDWFGLTHIVRDIQTGVSVIIEPELFPAAVRTEPDYGSCSREAAGSSRRQEDPEPGDMRLYIPGDPIRRIHWKLSEKTGQTLVREASPESLRPVALMLETVLLVKTTSSR